MSKMSRRLFLGAAATSMGTAAAHWAPADRPLEGAIFHERRLDQARANFRNFEWVRQRAESLRQSVAPLMQLSLKELWELVPGPRLGRTIDVVMTRDFAGSTTRRKPCPTCGVDKGYELRPATGRFTVYCSACRDRFPKNDFGSFFQSSKGPDGFFDVRSGDRSLLAAQTTPSDISQVPIVDDGSGWRDGEGFVYRFVPYAVDQLWNWLLSGARDLAECWALTEDRECARRAAVIIDRVADCYPDMDWAPLAKMGWYHSDGDSGKGKIFGRISESRALPNLVRAYDQTLSFVAADDELHRFLKEQSTRWSLPTEKGTAAAYRDAIENRLLRTGLKAVQDQQIRGNHGMHELAAAWCAMALQSDNETPSWLEWIFSETGLAVPQTILGHMDRDGLGDEGAPAYAWGWGTAFHELAELLRLYGHYDRWVLPRDFVPFRRAYTAPQRLELPDGRVPTLGDFGSCMEFASSPENTGHLFEGFRLTGDPEIAAEIARVKPDLDVCRDAFDENPGVWPERIREAAGKSLARTPGGNFLPGFGLATLHLPGSQGDTAVWIAFGRNRGHGHPDSLNLGMISHSVDLLPDIGYPDFATRNYAKRHDWTSNTISHNTVVVDGVRQQEIWGGHTQIYKRLPQLGIGLMEFESPAYSQTSLYRRTVALIRRPDGGAYCWDLFRVGGGRQPMQSWHGPEGDLQVSQSIGRHESHLDLQEATEYLTSYTRLDPQPDKPLTLRYLSHPRWRKDATRIGLELSVLSGPGMEATLAVNFKPSMRTRAEKLDYLFLRSEPADPLTLFSTLLVPDPAQASSLHVDPLKLDKEGGAAAIRVELGDGWSDTLVSCGHVGSPFHWEPRHSLNGGFAWIRRHSGTLHSMFICGGTSLVLPEGTLTASTTFTGSIENIRTDRDGQLWVACRSEMALPPDLIGEVIRLGHHPQRDSSFEIYGRQGNELNLGANTVITGFENPRDYSQGFSQLCEPGQPWELKGHAFLDRSTGAKHGWGELK